MGGAGGRARPKFWDPTVAVTWTAQTKVERIRDLVRDREQVFAKHRRIANPDLEAKSFEQLHRILLDKSTYRSRFDRYTEFCRAVDIPPFPISVSTIALFAFAKYSFRQNSCGSLRSEIDRIRRGTLHIWQSTAAFHEIDEDKADLESALTAFVAETGSSNPAEDLPALSRRDSSLYGGEEASVTHEENQQVVFLSSTRITARKPGSSVTDKYNPTDELDLLDDPDYEEPSNHQRPSDEAMEPNGVEQLPVPGLPQPGERFPSANDLLIQCYRAIHPVFGTGAKLVESQTMAIIECARSNLKYRATPGGCCKWKIGAIVDPSSGEAIVDSAASNLVHNHGPCDMILKNPDWRAPIKNPVVRRAFGLSELPARRSSAPWTVKAQPPAKKLKLLPSDNLPSAVPPSRSHISPVVPPPPEISSSVRHPLVVSQASIPRFSAPPPLPPLSTTARTEFFSQLESFVTALVPSLPPSMPSLLATRLSEQGGIESFESLSRLCTYEPTTLVKFFEAVGGVRARIGTYREEEEESSLAARPLVAGSVDVVNGLEMLRDKLEQAKRGGLDV